MNKAPFIQSIKIALFISVPFFLILSIMDSNLSWEKFTHVTFAKVGLGSLFLFVMIVAMRARNDLAMATGQPIVMHPSHSFDESGHQYDFEKSTPINPGSGLPMAGAVDIMGNSFGDNSHH